MKILSFLFLLSIFSEAGLEISKLNEIEEKQSLLRDEVNDLESVIFLQDTAIFTFENQIDKLEKDINTKKLFLNQRLRALLMFELPDDLFFLYTLKNIDDYFLLSSYISYLIKKDYNNIKDLEADIYRLNDTRLLLEKEKLDLSVKKASLNEKITKLKQIILEKQKLLKVLSSSKKSVEKYKERKVFSDNRISLIAASKPESKVVDVKINIFKDLKKPLSEGVIVGSYGKFWNSKLKNWTYNNGVLIKSNYGQNVYSVKKGQVKYSGWIDGYGKVLIVAHSNGVFSVYAHLSKILFKQGDSVEGGATIAYVGDTGSVEEPTLYFELRFFSDNIDPSPLISSL